MPRRVDRSTALFLLLFSTGLTAPAAPPLWDTDHPIGFAQPVLLSLAPVADGRLRYVDRDGLRTLEAPPPAAKPAAIDPPAPDLAAPTLVPSPSFVEPEPQTRIVDGGSASPPPQSVVPDIRPAEPQPGRSVQQRKTAAARALNRSRIRSKAPEPVAETLPSGVVPRRYGVTDWAERALAR